MESPRNPDQGIEILRQQHLDGRIDGDEFQERLGRCLGAKTYAELDALVADFPTEDAKQGRARPARVWRPWPFGLVPLFVIAAIAFSGGHLLWLVFPLFVFFFVARPLAWRASCGPRYTTRTRPGGEL